MSLKFNPVEYAMEMQVLGYGLMIFGALMLVLVGILGTRMYQNSKLPEEDPRD